MSSLLEIFQAQTVNDTSSPFRSPLTVHTYSASIAGTGAIGATITLQGCNDVVFWHDLGTISLSGTTSASGRLELVAIYNYHRAVISDLHGTGAAVTLLGEFVSNAAVARRRVVALTDAATVTPNADTTDVGSLASLGQTTAFANPTGSPVDGQLLTLRVKSASVRSLTWDTEYRGGADVALPSATSGSGLTDYWQFVRNAAGTSWDILTASAGY